MTTKQNAIDLLNRMLEEISKDSTGDEVWLTVTETATPGQLTPKWHETDTKFMATGHRSFEIELRYINTEERLAYGTEEGIRNGIGLS